MRLDKLMEDRRNYKYINTRYRNYENVLISMFEFDNLPNGLNRDYIMKSLIRFGNCLITKINGEFYSDAFAGGGVIDNYGIFKTGFNTSRNGEQSDEKRMYWNSVDDIDENDINNAWALIWYNAEHMPNFDIEIQANDDIEIDKSLRAIIKNTRMHPIPVAKNKKMRDALNSIIKDINEGKDVTLLNEIAFEDIVKMQASGEIVDTVNIDVLNITDVNASDKIQYIAKLKDDNMRWFFSKYGIPIKNNSKTAQQNNQELEGYDRYSFVYPVDMFEHIKNGFDIFNKIWGEKVVVHFSEVWQQSFNNAMKCEHDINADVQSDETNEENVDVQNDEIIEENAGDHVDDVIQNEEGGKE